MKKQNLVVNGAHGRMGQEILKLAATEKWIADIVPADYKNREGAKALRKLKPVNSTVAIDFSLPEGLGESLKWYLANEVPVVLGATGLEEAEFKKIQKAAEKIPILWSPNMSIGVNILIRVIQELGVLAKDYDWQLEEFHHKRKKDAPSGTAKWLQFAAEKAVKRKLPPVLAGRGGGIHGIHKLWLMGEEEVLTIEHSALSRGLFARGALAAAKWLSGQPAGFYSLQDMLDAH